RSQARRSHQRVTAEDSMGQPQINKLFGVRKDSEGSTSSGGQSPWEIGHAYYDQRDWYTRDARIHGAGYGHGASEHPDVGSFAYPREFDHPSHVPAAEEVN